MLSSRSGVGPRRDLVRISGVKATMPRSSSIWLSLMLGILVLMMQARMWQESGEKNNLCLRIFVSRKIVAIFIQEMFAVYFVSFRISSLWKIEFLGKLEEVFGVKWLGWFIL